jgi:hypothetical protein
VARHQKERKALLEAQKKENIARTEKRNQSKAKGLKAFLGKVTGISALIRKKHKQQDQAKTKKQEQAFKTLKTRQNRQVQDMNRRFRALGSLERRESRSLKTALQRRQYKNLGRAFRQTAPAREPEKPKRLSQEFSRHTAAQARTTPLHSSQEKLEKIRQTGQDITKPKTSEEAKAQDSLAEAFRLAAKQKAKREQDKDRTRDDPGRTMSR